MGTELENDIRDFDSSEDNNATQPFAFQPQNIHDRMAAMTAKHSFSWMIWNPITMINFG
jgi:hypothetical protein